jgi:putative peptidoglycan lipid II flippase
MDATNPQDAPSDAIVARHTRLVRRTALVSVLTLASRLLGFLREALTAMLFGGKSPILDAFLTAWRIPNLFRRLLGEGALSTSLQTAITEEDARGGNRAGSALFQRVVWLTLWILLVVCAGVMLAIQVVPEQIGGFRPLGEPATAQAIRELTVRLMPFVVLVCLAALAGGALNVRGHYSLPTLAPVAMNVVWIATLLWIGWAFGWGQRGETGFDPERHFAMARALSWGVLLSGLAQLAVQIPPLVREGLIGRIDRGVRQGVRSAGAVLRTAAPLAVGAAVYQINVMIDGFMAVGLLSEGGPTALYFANRIQQFPLALVATAATASVFPSLKALGHLGRRDELRVLHDRTQHAIAFLALPAGAGLLALSGPIASACLEYGAFEADDSARVGRAMAVLALALLPAGAVGLVSRVYYALGDFRTPVIASVWILIANSLLNVLFVVGLGLDVEGIALGTAAATWLHLAILLPALGRRYGLPRSGVTRMAELASMLFAALLSAVVAWGLAHWLLATLPSDWRPGPRSALAIGPAIVAAGLVYLACVRLLGVSEWRLFEARVRARFGSGKR